MNSLDTLIKLSKTKVDEQRLVLAKLQEQLTVILAQIEDLENEQEAQRALLHSCPELSLTYGDYVKSCLKKMELLQKKRRSADYAVNLARDKLAEVFEEQKRYEIAQQNRIEEEEREEQRKETITLDEVGSISFVRKKKS